ncbi:hypothetical protein SH528x_003868 [Novipirellula sp. SH528]|uniref:hypothetical protein n=1 Tax=Novipirellula sp. SH528 TaxID=3454466 RepID=UPI003F9EFBF6
MKRRVFVQQCALLPGLALHHDSAQASQANARVSIRDYCFDGTYAEFELFVGEDLGYYLAEWKPYAEAFVLRTRKMKLRAENANLQMGYLNVHSAGKSVALSSREYLFRICGVSVQTSVVSAEFPTRGRKDYEATQHQIEQIYSEIWQLNLKHQYVWAAMDSFRHPPLPIEIDPVTGLRVYRN